MEVRDRLLLAAEEQFADRGVLDARLADIRQDAGVSVGALYHHFPDKSGLYREVWTHALNDYQRTLWEVVRESATAEDGVRAGVTEHLRWVTDNRSRAIVLAAPRPAGGESSPDNREFLRSVMSWWRTHAAYGVLRELELTLAYALWLGPAQEYSRQWLSGAVDDPPISLAPALADAAWLTVRAPTTKGSKR